MKKVKENWEKITTTDNKHYYVSNLGNIASRKKGIKKIRIMKPSMDKNGYMVIGIAKKQYKVHRLVASCFCKKGDGHSEVNHINGIKSDNRAINLEWTDHSGNQRHRRKVLKHNVCKLIHLPTKQRYSSLWEAYKQTKVSVRKINHDILSGTGDWAWKS